MERDGQKIMMEKEYEGLTNPGMILAFVSSVFGFLSFADAFFELPVDSVFAMGLIRLFLGFIFFLAAMVNLLKGRAAGNLNLIFSVCFGLFSGSSILVKTFQNSMVVLEQPPIYALLQIVCALYLAAILPVMKKLPMYQWICFACVVIGLLCGASCEFTGWMILKRISGICFLIFGCLNIYTGLSWTIEELPQGPLMEQVFFKNKPVQ